MSIYRYRYRYRYTLASSLSRVGRVNPNPTFPLSSCLQPEQIKRIMRPTDVPDAGLHIYVYIYTYIIYLFIYLFI